MLRGKSHNFFTTQGNYFIWFVYLVTSKTVLEGGSQHNACHSYNVPWVGVRIFYYSIELYITLSLSTLKKVQKIFPSDWRCYTLILLIVCDAGVITEHFLLHYMSVIKWHWFGSDKRGGHKPLKFSSKILFKSLTLEVFMMMWNFTFIADKNM
jgi:hypothetical protein